MWRLRRLPWPSLRHIEHSSPHHHRFLRTSTSSLHPRPTCHARYRAMHSHTHTHSHANPSVPNIHTPTSHHTTRHTHACESHAADGATTPATSTSTPISTATSPSASASAPTGTCASPPPPSSCSTATVTATSTSTATSSSSPSPSPDVPPCTSDPTPTLTAERAAASAYPTTLSDGSGLPGFYQRPLPQTLISFSSNRGRKIFREAMATGGMEGYFALAEQFQTQSEPSYCGPATLAMILNALALDPNRIWKGNWRWFSEEMLESCDTRKGGAALKDVDKDGMTYEEFLFLAECNGAGVQAFRACDSDEAKFRAGILAATSRTDLHLVASFSRKALGQTGSGHYSPIGGYHAGLDLALVLDVARFKYPPYWAPVSLLWRAISEVDDVTGRGRGYFLMSRGRPSSSFTPLSSACRIAADRIAWEKLAEYFCDQLPYKLREAQCKTPKQVFDVILSSLPVALSSVFTMYTHDLSRRLHASISPQQASSSQQPHPPHLAHYSYVSPDSTHHHPHAIPPMTTIAPLLQQLSETSLYQCLASDASHEFKLEVSTQGHHPEDDPLPDRIIPTTPSSRIPLHLRFHLAGGFIRPDHRSVELELATLVLLACPAQVFDAIDDGEIRSQIDKMLDIHSLPTQLQHEVHNLRQQMGILSDFCSCGHRMIHSTPTTAPNVKLANTVQHTYNRHAPHPPNTAVWMTFPPPKKSFTASSTSSIASSHDTKHRFVTRK